MAGVFVGALDTSIISPAFPLIARTFHITLAWLAWTVTTYTVTYVAATVLAGAAGDRYGRRLLFRAGVGAFGIASLMAALSHSFAIFLVARAVQGLGAGAVYPNAQAEGVRFFPPERRGLALGIFGAVFGLAAMIGPVVGGALAQYFGWPSVFLVNIPIAAVVILLSLRVPESPRTDRVPPDFIAGTVFAVFLATVLLTLEVSGPARWALLVAAAATLVVFIVRERRPKGAPFLDPHAFSGVRGAALVAGAAVIGLDMSAAVFVPTLAQQVLHLSTLDSGFALLPAALSGAVLAGVGGVLTDRRGARIVLQIGLLFALIGGVLLALPGMTLWRFIFAMFAFGVGTAFTMGAPLNRMALALHSDEQAGEALAAVAVFRSVGLAAGPVLLTLAMAFHRFEGMFLAVAIASLLGGLVFFIVPDTKAHAKAQSAA
ncbi:MAG: MFS transporter [Thermaerobacter sp.]|nr:MFS transporter [Thermaerobacter sp.]